MSLKRHAFRNKLMEIIEDMAPVFKNRSRFGETEPARFLNIKDIQITTFDSFDEYTEVLARISLQSDLGSWEQDLLIRSFSEPITFQNELDRFTELEKRCLTLENVNPTPLIHLDRDKYRVIYDLGDSNPLSSFKSKIKNFDLQVGRLVAALQGSVKMSLEDTNLREFMNLIMNYIPISDVEKEKIQMLLEPHYPIIRNTDGGYNPSILFDPEKIKVQVTQGDQFSFVVPPIKPDLAVVDRMTDIAVYFTERAYKEFSDFGHLDATIRDVGEFFAGYNNVFSKLAETNLAIIYPHGITLDLQMLISYFLYEMREHEQPFTSPDSLRYLYFLLIKKPFLLY